MYGQRSVTISLTVFSEPMLSLATWQTHSVRHTPSVQTRGTLISVLRPLGEWTIDLEKHKLWTLCDCRTTSCRCHYTECTFTRML